MCSTCHSLFYVPPPIVEDYDYDEDMPPLVPVAFGVDTIDPHNDMNMGV